MSENRCEAETRVKRGAAWIQHTLRCQKDAGHETKPGDEAHTFKDGARTTVWFGVPQKVQDNTRFRFGLGR